MIWGFIHAAPFANLDKSAPAYGNAKHVHLTGLSGGFNGIMVSKNM